jgi:hypothetical protein
MNAKNWLPVEELVRSGQLASHAVRPIVALIQRYGRRLAPLPPDWWEDPPAGSRSTSDIRTCRGKARASRGQLLPALFSHSPKARKDARRI